MIKEDMDETNSGYAKQVGGLKGKKIDSVTFEYETQVKEMHLNTARMAHGGFLTFIAKPYNSPGYNGSLVNILALLNCVFGSLIYVVEN